MGRSRLPSSQHQRGGRKRSTDAYRRDAGRRPHRMEVDVSGLWTDEDEIDKGRLSITALVANPFIVKAVVDAQTVFTANDLGLTSVTLSVRDSAGHTMTETFMVKVTSNNVPEDANAIEEMTINEPEIKTIEFSDVFKDKDGGDVMVSSTGVSNKDAVLAVFTNDNTNLAIVGRATGSLPVVVLEVGSETFLVDFVNSFIDRDSDVLSYDVSVLEYHFSD